MKNYTIAVAGTGYVGLSIATLLSQHHQVTAVDVIPEKVEKINNRISPIQGKHSVNHVFSSPTSIINFTSKKPSYDDTRRSGRDNELLQRAQSDL